MSQYAREHPDEAPLFEVYPRSNLPQHLFQLPTKSQLAYTKQRQRTNTNNMSDELNSMVDINSIDLSTVETDFPLLDSGVVTAQIQACSFERDTAKKGDSAKPYLTVKYALTAPHKTTGHEGMTVKTINPGDRGSTLSENIYYGNYEDKKTGETKKYGIDRIAKLREAVFGKAAEGQRFVPAEMLGQPITLRLKFDPRPTNKATGEVYGPRTEVADYVRKAR